MTTTSTQRRTPRLLSYTEIDTALTCWARWDFAYGGRLAGSTLSSRSTAPILSEGRAWGAAVAAWHQGGGSTEAAHVAHRELEASVDADEKAIHDAGAYVDLEAGLAMRNRLGAMLEHYTATATPLPNLSRIEDQLVVKVPSRTGARASNRFRFLAYLDGYTIDEAGHPWIVEYKLRRQLQPVELVMKARQIRWYAWALRQANPELEPMGVLVDERLNEVPRPARMVKGRKKGEDLVPSHAKDQLTTPALYAEACRTAGVEPEADTLHALGQRRWQQRIPVMLRPGEVTAAGRELVSAAKLIRDLDSGEVEPVRHATQMTCGGCRYREVCAEPTDTLFVDSLFERGLPKRDRDPITLTTRKG